MNHSIVFNYISMKTLPNSFKGCNRLRITGCMIDLFSFMSRRKRCMSPPSPRWHLIQYNSVTIFSTLCKLLLVWLFGYRLELTTLNRIFSRVRSEAVGPQFRVLLTGMIWAGPAALSLSFYRISILCL